MAGASTSSPASPLGESDTPLGSTFAVVSWGCTATHWLVKLLNAHPEMLCLHDLRRGLSRVDPETRLVPDLTYLLSIAEMRTYFRAVGDCHGIERSSIPTLRTQLANRGILLYVAILERHPVLRADSQFALIRQGTNRQIHQERLAELARQFPEVGRQEGADEKLDFLLSVAYCNAITSERGLAPMFRMEDLTTSPTAIDRLVRTLTGGNLGYCDAMDSVFHGHVASHYAGKRQTPAERYHSWPGWKRELFALALRREAAVAYRELGYDLSFCADESPTFDKLSEAAPTPAAQ